MKKMIVCNRQTNCTSRFSKRFREKVNRYKRRKRVFNNPIRPLEVDANIGTDEAKNQEH